MPSTCHFALPGLVPSQARRGTLPWCTPEHTRRRNDDAFLIESQCSRQRALTGRLLKQWYAPPCATVSSIAMKGCPLSCNSSKRRICRQFDRCVILEALYKGRETPRSCPALTSLYSSFFRRQRQVPSRLRRLCPRGLASLALLSSALAGPPSASSSLSDATPGQTPLISTTFLSHGHGHGLLATGPATLELGEPPFAIATNVNIAASWSPQHLYVLVMLTSHRCHSGVSLLTWRHDLLMFKPKAKLSHCRVRQPLHLGAPACDSQHQCRVRQC